MTGTRLPVIKLFLDALNGFIDVLDIGMLDGSRIQTRRMHLTEHKQGNFAQTERFRSSVWIIYVSSAD